MTTENETEQEFKNRYVWYSLKHKFILEKLNRLPEKLSYRAFVKSLDIGIDATGGIIGDTYKITDQDKWEEVRKKLNIPALDEFHAGWSPVLF